MMTLNRKALWALAAVTLIAAVTLSIRHFTQGGMAAFAPTVEVPVDHDSAAQWQAVCDQGHMPWRVNPVSVAEVFLKSTVEDQVLEPDALVAETVSDTAAIFHVRTGPIRRLYLRPAYPDREGSIWLVFGYDPRQ